MSEAGPARKGPLVWVLCGSGRGVGKTHLAMELCRILPGAVYAKQGSSQRLPGKPDSLFRTDEELDGFLRRAEGVGPHHFVVESNRLALRGRGDIIIFLGGDGRFAPPGAAHAAGGGHALHVGARPDAERLRSIAHVALDGMRPRQDSSAWRESLARTGLEPTVIRLVLEALEAQAEWNGRTRE